VTRKSSWRTRSTAHGPIVVERFFGQLLQPGGGANMVDSQVATLTSLAKRATQVLAIAAEMLTRSLPVQHPAARHIAT
jgi:hypothetical protein